MSNELYAVADFCLIPMGTNEPSVAEHIAVCHKILEKSGLKFEVCDLEGPWSEVTKAIYDCHAAVHTNGVSRIATDIRIGTRTDREIVPGEGNKGKVQRVQEILERRGNSTL
ncbi:YkoF-like protein [Imleria badia]|nr:YkoF-like protein [Imleria badia]